MVTLTERRMERRVRDRVKIQMKEEDVGVHVRRSTETRVES